jgi:hypothetical protein
MTKLIKVTYLTESNRLNVVFAHGLMGQRLRHSAPGPKTTTVLAGLARARHSGLDRVDTENPYTAPNLKLRSNPRNLRQARKLERKAGLDLGLTGWLSGFIQDNSVGERQRVLDEIGNDR